MLRGLNLPCSQSPISRPSRTGCLVPSALSSSATIMSKVFTMSLRLCLPTVGIALVGSFALSGCLTMPTGQSGASSSSGAGGNVSVSRPTQGEIEAARRAELSKNDAVVEFRSPCEGLFIPEVKRTTFQGMIPMYSMRVLNNSPHRYAVKYDLTLVERTTNVMVNSSSQFTEEREFVVRPVTFVQFELARQNHSGGRTVAGVKKIVVLSCTKT
jgi:hypothetical protein